MRSAPPPVPERVGRYSIVAPIASGGMATVYLARSRGVGGFERDVALKLTHAHLRESPEFAAIVLEEAKLAVRIRHTNVVSILDVGEDPLGLFLVMEYVEGDTLSGLIRQGRAQKRPMPLRIAMRVLLDALAGLHAAHETRGEDGAPLDVVHRDFSPHNILVGVDGIAKLTDFGIAKAASRAGHTATGVIKGKASYMAPEQARGHLVDRRCDVWAAGVVAWEILAGRRMYSNLDEVAVLLRVVSEPPPQLREACPDVSPELEQVVASALTIDREARCPTALDLARRLAAAFVRRDSIAEPSEVAEYVRAVAGAKLAERRALATGTEKTRRLDADVTAPQDPEDLPRLLAPSLHSAETRAATPAAQRESGEPTRTQTAATADAPLTVDAPPSVAKRALTIGAVAAAIAGVALFASRGGPTPTTASAPATTASASPTTTAAPSPPPSATDTAPSIAATALPRAEPPAAEKRAPSKAADKPRAPRAAASAAPSSAGNAPAPLAPSPYDDRGVTSR